MPLALPRGATSVPSGAAPPLGGRGRGRWQPSLLCAREQPLRAEDGVAHALDEFLSHQVAVAAGLTREEVIAIRLFTGPMFMKYNAKLRQFPAAAVAALKGNAYVTSIHAVVSAIIKLSRTWKIPDDRKVYRGLGGMLLPQKFWREDAYGCRGS